MMRKIKSFLFENKTETQTIIKNTFWLSGSAFVSRLIRAGMIIYAARVLGTEGYGVFSYVLSVAGFFTVFSDIGISGILTRQAVQEPEKLKEYFSTTAILKGILIVLTIGITIFVMPSFTKIAEADSLIPLAALLLAFDSLRNFAVSLIRARNKMELESGINMFTDMCITILGIVALIVAPSTKLLAYGYVAGAGIGSFVSFVAIRKNLSGIFSHFKLSLAKQILSSAWPFAIMSIFGGFMINIDMIIVGWFRTASELGLYGAAMRPINVIYIIPGIFAVSIFPIASKFIKNGNTARTKRLLERSLASILAIGIPIVAGGIIVAPELTVLLFGEAYEDATLPFQILLLTIPFVFIGSILGNVLFAYDRQKSFIGAYGLGAFVNVALDFLLIPPFGISGSAVATVCSQLVSNGFLWKTMKKTNPFRLFRNLKKVILATVVMSAVCLALTGFGIPVIATIVAGGGIYFATLFVLKEPLLAYVNPKKLLE